MLLALFDIWWSSRRRGRCAGALRLQGIWGRGRRAGTICLLVLYGAHVIAMWCEDLLDSVLMEAELVQTRWRIFGWEFEHTPCVGEIIKLVGWRICCWRSLISGDQGGEVVWWDPFNYRKLEVGAEGPERFASVLYGTHVMLRQVMGCRLGWVGLA